MKHVFLLLVTVAMTAACFPWKSVPDRLDSFVKDAETSFREYTEEDWQNSRTEYQKLIDEYNKHKDQYTREQKSRVIKDIGRYHALMLMSGFEEAVSAVNSIKEALPSYIKGVGEVIKESKGEIKDLLESILGTEKSLENVTDSLENLLEGLDTL